MTPFVTRGLPMFAAVVARMSYRARDTARRWAATTCLQGEMRPALKSRFARAEHRACQASLVRYRRELIPLPVPCARRLGRARYRYVAGNRSTAVAYAVLPLDVPPSLR